ncbi:hypothetical protein QFC20_006614 [Naganishia adeliensis]|uniref:Uncharacterized protein n=1 Tax=Naganishia adeliensis TaxID=92952 RepID=A0ACC2VAG9_9TREE|nr:hypothetical protein QFC20_006614 [Naganishia adeliensis]
MSTQTTIAARNRKEKIMSEVLPTEEIWNEWVKNESRARQGKGYYPSLDRRFLEFLVSCEIDLLSVEHNLALEQPAERIHKSMDKVRRVASQRIGNERLEAYRARVREAFEAYFRGSVWATWEDEAVSVNSLEGEEEGYAKEVEARGRDAAIKEVQARSRNRSKRWTSRPALRWTSMIRLRVLRDRRDLAVGSSEKNRKLIEDVQPLAKQGDETKSAGMAVTSEMEVDHAL